MKTVFKYEVPLSETFHIDLPEGAIFLTLQVQFSTPQMWFRVDSERPLQRQVFGVCGTGEPIPTAVLEAPFLGTFQLSRGALVFHVFGGNCE